MFDDLFVVGMLATVAVMEALYIAVDLCLWH